MKALVSLGDAVEVRDVPEPTPKAGEVLIRVHSCGICGSDVHSVEAGASRPGQIMGHEVSGTDVQTGQMVAVNPLGACGSCVWCEQELSIRCRNVPNIGLNAPGGFAEYLAVPAAQVVPLPDTMGPEEGAHVEPLAVAVRAVREGQVTASQTVLVFGAGPIGLNTIVAARAAGARSVIAVEPTPARRAAALALGAEIVLDPSEVRETGEFDCVFECAGAPPVLSRCVEQAREGGTIVLVALGRTPSPLPTRLFVAKNLRMVSSTAFGPADYQNAFALIRDGVVNVQPLITERIPLEAAPEAFVRLRKPDGAVGILVQPWLTS